MANSSTGFFGLKPIRYVDGRDYTGATITCYVSAEYAAALYIGDAVMISDETDDADAFGRYLSIEKATITDGGQILGVVTSFVDSRLEDTKRVKSSGGIEALAKVCMAQDVVFQIKGAGGGTVTAATFLGLNARMVAGTDSAITGLSGDGLDEGSGTAPAANASNPLVILGISDLPGNTLGDYAIWDVIINCPQLFNLGGATAVGRHLGVATA
jgi:hypothetical protein